MSQNQHRGVGQYRPPSDPPDVFWRWADVAGIELRRLWDVASDVSDIALTSPAELRQREAEWAGAFHFTAIAMRHVAKAFSVLELEPSDELVGRVFDRVTILRNVIEHWDETAAAFHGVDPMTRSSAAFAEADPDAYPWSWSTLNDRPDRIGGLPVAEVAEALRRSIEIVTTTYPRG